MYFKFSVIWEINGFIKERQLPGWLYNRYPQSKNNLFLDIS